MNDTCECGHSMEEHYKKSHYNSGKIIRREYRGCLMKHCFCGKFVEEGKRWSG